jgi:hypothetical protein
MSEQFQARVRSQLKLALLGDCGCLRTLTEIEDEAKLAGLTGAEIDAALAGRSFEARTAAALAFACMVKSGQRALVDQARTRALHLGVTDCELEAVDAEAKRILASMPS